MVRRGYEKASKSYLYKLNIANNSSFPSSVPQILIFNQHSTRNGEALLRALFRSLQVNSSSVDYAIFCTNTLQEKGAEKRGIV